MIQFSTPDFNFLFVENTIDEPSCLNKEDEVFYSSIKDKLDKEIREPHLSTIERILAYSKNNVH